MRWQVHSGIVALDWHQKFVAFELSPTISFAQSLIDGKKVPPF
jgi:hypothetical protein